MLSRRSRALGDKTQRRSALPSDSALTVHPGPDGLSAGEHAALLTHFGSSLLISGRRSRVLEPAGCHVAEAAVGLVLLGGEAESPPLHCSHHREPVVCL
ncbi:hypothetical protein MHYP_G00218500 [Metynnis hypsauchen]